MSSESSPAMRFGAEPDPAAAVSIDCDETALVTFRLGWQTYALPLGCIDRALRMVAITEIPEAPPAVLGMIDLQGEVAPVIDVRRRLGLARQRLHLDNRLLVVRINQRALAFAVDEAGAVLTVATSVIEKPPDVVARARPLAAVIRRPEGMILVLDAERLLPADERWQLALGSDHGYLPAEITGAGISQLTRIRGIGKAYAEKLARAGLHSLPELAAATAEEVVLLLGLPAARHAEAASWIEQAIALAQTTNNGATNNGATDDAATDNAATSDDRPRGIIR